MRLITLASSEANQSGVTLAEGGAILLNTFNANIEVAENSQIALKSITTEFSSESAEIDDFSDFVLELTTLEVDSFYGYTNATTGKLNGARQNIIDVIPATQLKVHVAEGGGDEFRLRWTPSYPTFLDLSNKKPFVMNQLGVRLTKYDGESIALDGPMFVSLLIKGPGDR
tara:strand:- start:1062 stop:1571 length:510 start_codon:yes stop_codon:yes gene_type:complete